MSDVFQLLEHFQYQERRLKEKAKKLREIEDQILAENKKAALAKSKLSQILSEKERLRANLDEMKAFNVVLDVQHEAMDKTVAQVAEELGRLKLRLKELSENEPLQPSES